MRTIFNNQTYGLLNTRTGKLFSPIRIYGTWYRGLYDSETSAKIAAKKLNTSLKIIYDSLKDYDWEFDIDDIYGEYIPIELRGMEYDV